MRPVHVIFDLPSGSQADITFHNDQDARYVYESMKASAKYRKLGPPKMIRYVEEEVSID